MHALIKLILSVFGSGFLPKIPGTWGSLATIPFLLLFAELPRLTVCIIFVTSLIIGLFVCYRYYQQKDATFDAGWIVIDEDLGLFLAWLPFYWVGQTDAVSLFTLFVTFRVFDIIKIYPANWIDAQKSRWWAVIGDDLVSGIYAAGASYFLIPYLSKVLG